MSEQGEKNPSFSSVKLDKIFGIDELKDADESEKSSETFRLLEQLGVKELYVESENKGIIDVSPDDTNVLDDDTIDSDIVNAELHEVSEELQSFAIKKLDSIDLIYNELTDLLKLTKKLLKAAEYLIDTNPDGESINGTASLINAARNLIKEFTDLNRDNIRYEKMKEMERFKAEIKKELMEHKKRLESNKSEEREIPLIEFNQEEMVRTILKMQKEAAEKTAIAQNATSSPSAP